MLLKSGSFLRLIFLDSLLHLISILFLILDHMLLDNLPAFWCYILQFHFDQLFVWRHTCEHVHLALPLDHLLVDGLFVFVDALNFLWLQGYSVGVWGIGVNVILAEYLLDLLWVIIEVGLGTESLADDCYGVVVFGSVMLASYGTDINFLLVDHDHHLPLVLVPRNTSELAPTEQVSAHVVMGAFWLCVDYELEFILLVLDSLQQFVLNLSELHSALVFTNLVTKSDHHWSVIIVITVLSFIIVVIDLLSLTTIRFLGHDDLVNQLFIPWLLLDAIRHIPLS